MKSAYDIAPAVWLGLYFEAVDYFWCGGHQTADIHIQDLNGYPFYCFLIQLVNKTVSHLLQKTFTATNQIASTVKDTYSIANEMLSIHRCDIEVWRGSDRRGDQTNLLRSQWKPSYSRRNQISHRIRYVIKIELKCLVRQFDSQYNISSNIGSFFSSSMGYLKSFGSTIDSQLNSNEHTQGIYNELKDAVKGISVCLCI